jgi:hypothetical protein
LPATELTGGVAACLGTIVVFHAYLLGAGTLLIVLPEITPDIFPVHYELRKITYAVFP